MKQINIHGRSLGFVTIVIFAFASSGFTEVFHRCMAEEPMACCSSSESDNCDPPQKKAGVSVESDLSCRVTTIVGGFSVSPALTEKHDGNSQGTSVYSSILIEGENHYAPAINRQSSFLFPKTSSSSSTPRYLLFSSLII